MELTEISSREVWDKFVTESPQGHPLQLWGWGEAKLGNGWTAYRLAWEEEDTWLGGAQVLMWAIPKLGRYIAYVPRGPVVDEEHSVELLGMIVRWAKRNRALYVRIEPAWTSGAPAAPWRKSRNHLQLAETYTIDLRRSEDEMLEPMSRKHRQYIRKAERDGVEVHRATGESVHEMFELYQKTAERAGFGIHSKSYYERLLLELGEHGYLFYAIVDDEKVAFLWLVAASQTAYELYGGVNERGQEMKANYLLKWEAMRQMKALGYTTYDFNGRLNEGVSRFKDGFGPDATDYIGTYDYPIKTLGYHAWEQLWPLAKPVGRGLGRILKR